MKRDGCARRFDRIVKINERVPGSLRVSRASLFRTRRVSHFREGGAYVKRKEAKVTLRR